MGGDARRWWSYLVTDAVDPVEVAEAIVGPEGSSVVVSFDAGDPERLFAARFVPVSLERGQGLGVFTARGTDDAGEAELTIDPFHPDGRHGTIRFERRPRGARAETA